MDWKDLGLSASAKADVSDAWTQKDVGEFSGSYPATVPAEDAVLLVIHGQEGKFIRYQPAESPKNAVGADGLVRSYRFTA